MDTHHTETPTASGPAAKKTRHELAAHLGLSLRYIDDLTHNGALPFFKIGKSIRYDLTEVEASMRERFHVKAKSRNRSATSTRIAASGSL